jgi:hypothetical protein
LDIAKRVSSREGVSECADRAALPPSRHDNPFSTCWTKPGALPFQFSRGETATGLISRFAAQNWRGAIVGSHGSGKSTLLEALKPALAAAGCRVLSIMLRDGERRLPRTAWDFLANSAGRAGKSKDLRADTVQTQSVPPVLVIDGYEQLNWSERMRLHLCLPRGCGLLVASHAPSGLPTLIRLDPNGLLVERLVAMLCERSSTGVTAADVAASFASHGGNVREIFFDLYDRHERLRRGG